MSTPSKLSDTEISLVIEGDRKEIDKLILERLNHLVSVFTVHIDDEEARLKALELVTTELGTPETIRTRTRWIEAQIKEQEARTAMMNKVRDSVVIWAAIAFLGYIAYAGWNAIVGDIKSMLGK